MAKAPADIRSLARSHTKTAITTLARIMINKKAPMAARGMAGYGFMLARGKFTAVFFIQCLEAVGCQTVRLSEE